ncbi:hypothetical protein CEUSTIGMA_g10295.t1 [Chlamydomonas eustigma]|uniref:COP9 signalosome complex subunit 6 n=1 Tax=Chlamydomonas eustigma TaxID=1157962 RepID=A0A250XIX3_9CHLO|nr:hypothetical protein CEUSTIGMA_g10295.t1 [Chlamydomonas eustigma]|eukprot:GAX82869.1 hypothetical protein CEUSTIGMA_g10295.t1 [Chlamydomonas eustigma]
MMEESTRTSSSGLEFKLHPLVLINISDHHTRTKANSTSLSDVKVMGCLLGTQNGRTIDISNSFEMKFEHVSGGILIDNAFLLKKQDQYKQVFSKLDLVGWYTTGETIGDNEMIVNKKIMEMNESPVLLLLNPRIDNLRKDLPVTLYETEVHASEGSPTQIFVRASHSIETSDAERIGVDQVAKILPSGKATGSEQLTAHLVGMHTAIKMLSARVKMIQQLVVKMKSGELPCHHELLRKISSLVHSLPAMETPDFNLDYLKDYNDTLLAVYLSSLTKGVNSANEIVDKFSLAYDKSGRRRLAA